MNMFNPVTTYRIQFHKDFTFKHLHAIIPYLCKLGVKTIYASPVFEAVPGSTHGYDVVNPHRINPEIGTEQELKELTQRLQLLNISWLQDIVPNHMAFHSSNDWLMDVLEKGRQSPYASFFDITWTSPLFHGRLMVPFLSGSLEEALEKKEIKISYQKGKFVVTYFDQYYPLAPRSYKTILQSITPENEGIRLWIEQTQHLHAITDAVAYSFRWHELLLQLEALIHAGAIDSGECLQRIHSNTHQLTALLEAQVYRLCSWQETDHQINFRRFFTVNGLICLNMQSEEVFRLYHKKIKELLDENIIQGIRLDHIDGLYDPEEYLFRLRQLAGEQTYIVIEKILEPGEQLPAHWPIQGTTGYDFLGVVNNLLTRNNAAHRLSSFYNSFVPDKRSTHEKISEKKAAILSRNMGGELENLYRLFLELNLASPEELNTLGKDELKNAIGEFLIQFPVYRYYGNQTHVSAAGSKALQHVFSSIQKTKPPYAAATRLLEKVIIGNDQNEQSRLNALQFYQRCMQFTGPLMAKGVEDTLMYTFNRFIGHNEVGDSPEFFGLSVEEFHSRMMHRHTQTPLAMNATSTHDTKRGEDARARLNVLPAIAEEWIETVKQWRQWNADVKTNQAPDDNDEYFIYQTLLSVYPFSNEEDFSLRLEEYFTKALREGKQHSDWATPDVEYEKATLYFVQELLNPKRPFRKHFEKFLKKVSDHGIINSLTQVLLKFTCPGVSDNYQGTGSWDFSLVDPDNRRPVDYVRREQWLDELSKTSKNENFIPSLWSAREDSRIKLWFVHQLMQSRSSHAELFHKGRYVPLELKGRYREYAIAYARTFGDTWLITIAPLYTARLGEIQKKDLDKFNWRDTAVVLPPEAPEEWKNIFTDEQGKSDQEIPLHEVFKTIPFALLELKRKSTHRAAGILLSVTSLPSSFGIGDLGPEAFKFASYLSKAGQSCWQMLPLNPLSEEAGYSPYSSWSAMGGNTLLISPEKLRDEQWLSDHDLQNHLFGASAKVDYREVEHQKSSLLEVAWRNFNTDQTADKKQFENFIAKESFWLNDFACYAVIKKHQGNLPWYEWPDDLRSQEEHALAKIAEQYADHLLKIKWEQFIFFKQWHELKDYCQVLGIKLVGDLPFYVSHDSVEVWAHREIFSLDEKGKMKGIAGVPPDYFNANGQLWNMPVYDWEVLKDQQYEWWIKRIRKNLELFDLLRFDHFRAFSEFWNVPANETTAINGQWKKGPGADFFEQLKIEFPSMPFIAEDLGEISKEVESLRDDFNLPGMKVLQFAFNDDAASLFLPHQYDRRFVVYTGTHDNNTTSGWYKRELNRKAKKYLSAYAGHNVNERNVNETLIRLAYSSVAQLAIIPMQDILKLNEHARLNTPAVPEGNWTWKLKQDQSYESSASYLRQLSKTYGR